MIDEFRAHIDRYRARVTMLRSAFDRDGCLHAVSTRDPTYSIFLSRNPSSEAAFRVTSFHGREPIGHREYDALDGRSPTQNALAEFASADLKLVPRRTLTALCVRTRVIGAGNSFEVFIPLSEIEVEGQTYRVIRPDQGNKEYVPFHLGIEPYTTAIIKMVPGAERYEQYQAHEKASKAKELAVLQHAFPESHLSERPLLWDRNYLSDKQVTLRVDRQGNLVRPAGRQFRAAPSPAPS